MALTQMQIIQSLGEAMSWFERELSWGVPPTELRHLCGRIGELYAALISNGQMATEVNQKGYDVVSAEGERISVKTTAMMRNSGHVTFNANTLELVDRVIILRVNTDEMQIETLLDASTAEMIELLGGERNAKRMLSLSKLSGKPKNTFEIKSVKEVKFQGYLIRELETGTIEIDLNGVQISPVRPELRNIAKILNVSLLNSNGNLFNTRQLGSLIIKTIQEMND
ncbi:hypothetical protein [Paraglaciecola sp. 20A4]|uniref:DUF6998 domain-containing protein n=1 Tax=Paraglaciecola sp. 20A4 TaxID=2687288 RepID=UPI0014090C95|nr:hypothetical protein [Paraglaciecola sp. 20A4]